MSLKMSPVITQCPFVDSVQGRMEACCSVLPWHIVTKPRTTGPKAGRLLLLLMRPTNEIKEMDVVAWFPLSPEAKTAKDAAADRKW